MIEVEQLTKRYGPITAVDRRLARSSWRDDDAQNGPG
jgi:hypothetical protein